MAREADRLKWRVASEQNTKKEEKMGKGRAAKEEEVPVVEEDEEEGEEYRAMVARPLVVFGCRHIWHRDCLVREMGRRGTMGDGRRDLKCLAEHAV